MNNHVLLILLLSLCFSLSGAEPSGAPEALEGLELAVGEARYPVKLDEPVVLTTPGGEKIQITLCRSGVRRCETPYFSFDYEDSMKLEKKSDPGRTSAVLLGKFRSFAVEYFPEGIEFDSYVKSYAAGFSRDRDGLVFGSGGNYAALDMGGARWVGRSYLSALGESDAVITRIYRCEHGGSVYIFVEQFLQSQSAQGDKYAALLRRSFKFNAEK